MYMQCLYTSSDLCIIDSDSSGTYLGAYAKPAQRYPDCRCLP